MNAQKNTTHVYMIDNYDSFTYNLVQYFGELGAKVTVKRNDEISIADIEAEFADEVTETKKPTKRKR